MVQCHCVGLRQRSRVAPLSKAMRTAHGAEGVSYKAPELRRRATRIRAGNAHKPISRRNYAPNQFRRVGDGKLAETSLTSATYFKSLSARILYAIVYATNDAPNDAHRARRTLVSCRVMSRNHLEISIPTLCSCVRAPVGCNSLGHDSSKATRDVPVFLGRLDGCQNLLDAHPYVWTTRNLLDLANGSLLVPVRERARVLQDMCELGLRVDIGHRNICIESTE